MKVLSERATTNPQAKSEINVAELLTRKLTYLKPLLKSCIFLQNQRKDHLQILLNHKAVFQVKKSKWKGSEVHIKLKENAKPFCGRPYPIPLKQVAATKDEVYHQYRIGVIWELAPRKPRVIYVDFLVLGFPRRIVIFTQPAFPTDQFA